MNASAEISTRLAISAESWRRPSRRERSNVSPRARVNFSLRLRSPRLHQEKGSRKPRSVSACSKPSTLRSLNSSANGGEEGRVSKAGLAALNKELYGHIYSCRKTLRRLLTFAHGRCALVCALLLRLLSLLRSFFPSRFISFPFLSLTLFLSLSLFPPAPLLLSPPFLSIPYLARFSFARCLIPSPSSHTSICNNSLFCSSSVFLIFSLTRSILHTSFSSGLSFFYLSSRPLRFSTLCHQRLSNGYRPPSRGLTYLIIIINFAYFSCTFLHFRIKALSRLMVDCVTGALTSKTSLQS